MSKKGIKTQDYRKFLKLAENEEFMGSMSRDNAEQSGLGRLALSMRPMVTNIESAEPVTEASAKVASTIKTIKEMGLHAKHSPEWGNEFRVAFGPGEEHEPSAYYTDSHVDAIATAKSMKATKSKNEAADEDDEKGNVPPQFKGKDDSDDDESCDDCESKDCDGDCGDDEDKDDEKGDDDKKKDESLSEDGLPLMQMLAIGAAIPGRPVPVGAEPSEKNGAMMGTQNGNDAVHNQDDAFAKGGQTLGMAIPADRKGSYAKFTAPTTNDPTSVGDPQIKRIFIESHSSFSQAVSSLMLVGLTPDEATFVLGEGIELDQTIRSIMLRHIEEAKKSRPHSIVASAAKKRRAFAEAADEWLASRRSLQVDESTAGSRKGYSRWELKNKAIGKANNDPRATHAKALTRAGTERTNAAAATRAGSDMAQDGWDGTRARYLGDTAKRTSQVMTKYATMTRKRGDLDSKKLPK